MQLKLLAPLAAALALSACANTKPPVLAAEDPRNDGIATTCTPTNPDMKTPGPYTGTITMANDGWCGVFAVERDGKPFSLGLVRNRPEHGRVFIQKVANATRVEYTPNAGYVGSDAFTVALRSNSSGVEDTPLQVSVTVTPGTRASAEPEAEPASTTRPSTPAKRRTTRRSSSN